jgi:hypothetical protein
MSKNDPMTPAMERAERVLTKHGVGPEEIEAASPRPAKLVNAIIADLRKVNAESAQ